MDQVAAIYKDIVEQEIKGPSGELIRIEMFSHGALCMAVSGKCYLSLHEYNKSANRGACTQVCRHSYNVKDRETGHELDIENQFIMSPRDLKTIHFLNKMMDAGVRVFKLEGRARGAEYVRTVVECYKQAIESVIDGTYSEEKIKAWDERLYSVFNRGFWDGYYLGRKLGEWSPVYGSEATKKKLYVAKGMKFFSNIGVAEFLVETNSVKVGDEVVIIGPTTGAIFLTIDEIQVDYKKVDEAVKGDKFSIKVPEKVRPSDKLFVMVEDIKERRF